MLNRNDIQRAVDMQQRCYRLLRWMAKGVEDGFIKFESLGLQIWPNDCQWHPRRRILWAATRNATSGKKLISAPSFELGCSWQNTPSGRYGRQRRSRQSFWLDSLPPLSVGIVTSIPTTHWNKSVTPSGSKSIRCGRVSYLRKGHRRRMLKRCSALLLISAAAVWGHPSLSIHLGNLALTCMSGSKIRGNECCTTTPQHAGVDGVLTRISRPIGWKVRVRRNRCVRIMKSPSWCRSRWKYLAVELPCQGCEPPLQNTPIVLHLLRGATNDAVPSPTRALAAGTRPGPCIAT